METPPEIRRVGRYVVEKMLGKGGVGAVYLCRDPHIDRQVAVKVLSVSKGKEAGQSIRFMREALTTARLQHPGIPPVYSVHESSRGVVYYVMKPIEGRSLQEILDDLRAHDKSTLEKFDLYRLVEILRDVTDTMQYAHSRGFIHRDLKPSNIFVGDYGEVYVIDWGLTKDFRTPLSGPAEEVDENESSAPEERPFLEEESDESGIIDLLTLQDTVATGPAEASAALTLQGDILGTLAYMAPEQAAGESVLGPGADLYALGVILYELLTLQLPIQATTLKDVVERKTKGMIDPPEVRTPTRTLPPELCSASMQAMSARLEDRISSAGDFHRTLTFWLEGKTPLRIASPATFSAGDFQILPKSAGPGWAIEKEEITTRRHPRAGGSALIFSREYFGDTRFTLNFLALPDPDTEEVPGVRLFINSTLPATWRGLMEEGDEVYLGANSNTRAILYHNNAEILTNDYLLLEPYRNYRLQFERFGSELRVFLDRQLILYHRDRRTSAGFYVGFIHCGGGVTFRNVRVTTRGLPATIATLDLPEALMAEGCLAAAQKHFLAYAKSHRNRHEGAWARYRAAIATFRMDKIRSHADQILAPLKESHFQCLYYLGRARIEWEAENFHKAALILQEMLDEVESLTHLDAISDVAFSAVQQMLLTGGTGKRSWEVIDAWCRVALALGQRDESQRSMVPSVLWRWLILALTHHPEELNECMSFLRRTFGKGQGTFAELLTGMDPLLNILKRTATMKENNFLVDRVMRLILKFDDNLGNLETLARFYIHAGHEATATRIYSHIYALCLEHHYRIPATVGAWLGCITWISAQRGEARAIFLMMVAQGEEYGKDDARLMLGLDRFAQGEEAEAVKLWQTVRDDADAVSFNRHLVARGLLGELPPDAVDAGVPQRSDHRLLYCLLIGYKYFITWQKEPDTATGQQAREKAVALLLNARLRMRPSYDIYSASDTFERIPLALLGHELPPARVPEPLSPEEKIWVRNLSAAAAQAETADHRRTTSVRVSHSSRNRLAP